MVDEPLRSWSPPNPLDPAEPAVGAGGASPPWWVIAAVVGGAVVATYVVWFLTNSWLRNAYSDGRGYWVPAVALSVAGALWGLLMGGPDAVKRAGLGAAAGAVSGVVGSLLFGSTDTHFDAIDDTVLSGGSLLRALGWGGFTAAAWAATLGAATVRERMSHVGTGAAIGGFATGATMGLLAGTNLFGTRVVPTDLWWSLPIRDADAEVTVLPLLVLATAVPVTVAALNRRSVAVAGRPLLVGAVASLLVPIVGGAAGYSSDLDSARRDGTFAGGAPGPDVTTPEISIPDVSIPDIVVPTPPDSSGTTSPATSEPGSVETTDPTTPDTTVPTVSDSTEPDTTVPTVSDSTEPDTTVPTVSDSTEPDTTESTVPAASDPAAPDSTVPASVSSTAATTAPAASTTSAAASTSVATTAPGTSTTTTTAVATTAPAASTTSAAATTSPAASTSVATTAPGGSTTTVATSVPNDSGPDSTVGDSTPDTSLGSDPATPADTVALPFDAGIPFVVAYNGAATNDNGQTADVLIAVGRAAAPADADEIWNGPSTCATDGAAVIPFIIQVTTTDPAVTYVDVRFSQGAAVGGEAAATHPMTIEFHDPDGTTRCATATATDTSNTPAFTAWPAQNPAAPGYAYGYFVIPDLFSGDEALAQAAAAVTVVPVVNQVVTSTVLTIDGAAPIDVPAPAAGTPGQALDLVP